MLETDTLDILDYQDSEYSAIAAIGLYPEIIGTGALICVPVFPPIEYLVVTIRAITMSDDIFTFYSRIEAVHMFPGLPGMCEWLLSCHFLSGKEALPMG